ncbi:DUF86 domain-containing protein [Marispirochaeta sp.]|jgi:uncharacterized protein YutE (UPF0331/DUF86 family)|uniref:type VII toxin-antitoxin system HepT family RNase toxin n=1 Tax=Marispirochaeta sp. TaxID=2038653 RepID=UPI0029C7A00F|nr:DUF86 domain-containing protein [Marispirochaeta sp.]
MRIVPDNVILNKSAIIERALKRMREEYAANPALNDLTHIDAMILNIERACQAAIDMAQHIVAVQHLGMPQTSADAFILLERNKIISLQCARNMVSMTGFRNIAIHEYQELDMAVVRALAETRYTSLIDYCREIGTRIVVE